MGKAANATKKKSPSTVHHPPYLEMIGDAISTLKERTGSSQQAIAKFIEDKHQKLLPPNFRKLLSLQLKNLVKSNSLYKVKNSYKLSSTVDQGTATTNKGGGKKKKIAEKTKRLSQVKTPEALKNKQTTTTNNNNKQTTTTNNNNKKDETKKKSVVAAAAAASSGGKVKRLSQVKTPEAMKKKKPNLSPMKRKTNTPNPKPKPIASSRPTRKARK